MLPCSAPALNPWGTAGARRTPPAAPPLPEPGRPHGGVRPDPRRVSLGLPDSRGGWQGPGTHAHCRVGVGEKGGSDPLSGCLLPSSCPKPGSVGSLPAAGVVRGRLLPALRCRTVPQAELGALRRWHWGYRDLGASSCVGCCSAGTVQELCAVGTRRHGLSCFLSALDVPRAMAAPWLCPFWGRASAHPNWRRCSGACVLPARDGQRCLWGSPPWGAGLLAPATPSGDPLYLPIAVLVCPSPGETSAPHGAALIKRALFTGSHAS